jgi:uncharacterized protein YndB with AHSA1/START domain
MSAIRADDELLITRTFDAPIGLMFSLWSDVDHFQKWMGPEGFECPALEMDFRVGGKYRGMIHSPQYGDTWFGGKYREIEAPHRLVFTWQWESGPSAEVETLITISFAEHSGQTTMTFHQTPFLDVARRDSHYQGWTSLFNKLAAYAAKQQEQRT